MKTKSNKLLVNCLLVAGLALGGTAGQAWAYDPATRGTFLRSTSCGEMTQDIKNYGVSQETAYQNYVSGITDGINLSVAGKSDFFESTDGTSRYLFVKKYCEENPLDLFINAVGKMVLKITGKIPSKLAVPTTTTPCPPASNGKKKAM